MFAMEAMRLLRCRCLRQRPGEAPVPAKPPASSYSKPFNMTWTGALQQLLHKAKINCARFQLQRCSALCCSFGGHSNKPTGLPWRSHMMEMSLTHHGWAWSQIYRSSGSLLLCGKHLSDVCSHYRKIVVGMLASTIYNVFYLLHSTCILLLSYI